MIAHLSLLQTLKRHDLHLFSLELLVVSWIGCLHKKHVWHVLDIFQTYTVPEVLVVDHAIVKRAAAH